MKLKDLGLAAAVTALWGLNFSFIKLGVAHIDPWVLAGLRFTLTAFPLVLLLPRPALGWHWLAGYGLAFGVGTWGAVTLSLRAGLSPGLAAWLLQSSAFITPLLGLWWLKRPWLRHQRLGAAIALLGFVWVLLSSSGNASIAGMALVLGAAIALSEANLLIQHAQLKPEQVLAFLVWSSLFAPLPLFAMAYASSGSTVFTALPQQLQGMAMVSLAFQVYPTTLLGYGVWNALLTRYSAAEVAPMALLVPLFALLFAALIFNHRSSASQLFGMGLILLGLVVNSFAQRWLLRRQASSA